MDDSTLKCAFCDHIATLKNLATDEPMCRICANTSPENRARREIGIISPLVGTCKVCKKPIPKDDIFCLACRQNAGERYVQGAGAVQRIVNKRDMVDRPSHYTSGKIEVIDYIEDQKLGFRLGNAIKYISRAGKKDPHKYTEDLKKAIWYIQREIDTGGDGFATQEPADV